MEHTTRMVLIPEEFYNSLVSQRGNPNPMDSHLTSTFRQMDKILHTPTLNDTEKYALYNREFKRLKNLKTESHERSPIARVHVKSTPETDVNLKSVSEEISQAITNTLDKIMEQKSRLSSKTSSYYSSTENESDDDELTTPLKRMNPKRNASKVEKMQSINEKAEELTKYMRQNKDEYGLDDQGRILDKQKVPIKGSDAKQAALKLLNEQNAHSPPGMKTLRNRISKIPGAQKLFDAAKAQFTQEGKGIKVNNRIKTEQIVFRPSLWPVPRTF